MCQRLARVASFGASLWFEAILLRPLGRRPEPPPGRRFSAGPEDGFILDSEGELRAGVGRR
jgi:hypothetical protein